MAKINYSIPATSYCHGGTRALTAVKYIVLHYTAVSGDTAKNEAAYFSRNYSRYAGAHFFVDQKGHIAQSISMNVTAWSVGGSKYYGTNPAYYGKCTNFNSVSIEMCDQINKDAGAKQIAAVKWLIRYIQKSCPNAKTIIRHYDVNGKPCPARYLDTNKWSKLKAAVTGAAAPSTEEKTTVGAYKVKVASPDGILNARKKPNAKAKITAKLRNDEVYTIVETKNGWGKLKSGAGWINLSYTKKI